MLPLTFRFTMLLSCICALALFSCAEQPIQQAPPQELPENITEDMGKHFEQVSSIQKAVIRDDLDAVSAAANWLSANHTMVGAPEGWGPHIQEMRSFARAASEAKSVEAAASTLASMSRACGKCHEALEAEPRIPELGAKGLPPKDPAETVPHMLRHYWAVDQLWIGIVNPSEQSWNKGTEALDTVPLGPLKMTDDEEITTDVGDWAKAVHEISAQAAMAQDWDSRARLYGELLATCAQCHQKLEVEPELS